MKLLTLVGARPQFVKAATVSRAIRKHNHESSANPIFEYVLHTGQHYDNCMSQVFFEELDIPNPHYNLGISGGSHGQMTGRMLEGIERILMQERPDWVLVYGDTNSTLAGALAASKLHIPVAHVEAGLRSFNRYMPEEVNRILTDKISSLLFCPTETAVCNMKAEGITQGVHNVGDVMYDAAVFYSEIAVKKSNILEALELKTREYVLATFHREENTDDPLRLSGIIEGLGRIADDISVVVPLHPRTRKIIQRDETFDGFDKLQVVSPVPFLDMIQLEQSAQAILTDSGGVQKEAYFFRVPCITMRDETEWVETVKAGANVLVGADADTIYEAFCRLVKGNGDDLYWGEEFGVGKAANDIVCKLLAN